MSDTDVAVEIGKLADLDLYALRDRWQAAYGSAAPRSMSRELMIRAIAYRIQEERFGGLSPATRAKLLARPTAETKRGPVRKDRTMKPGTKFLREWNGRTHEVVAMADGQFLYQGIAYRSLSAIARQITGTRWSGPTFFGLNANQKGGRDAKI